MSGTVTNPFETILNELAEIKSAIGKIKQQPVIHENQPDSLTRDEAIEHLKEKGLPIKKSYFYRQTADGTIPSQRIGKRLIISRKELDFWIDSQKYRRVTPRQKAAELLAESASKRISQ
jgi:hypothetical protein